VVQTEIRSTIRVLCHTSADSQVTVRRWLLAYAGRRGPAMSTVSILRQAVTVKRHPIANDHDGLVSTLTELFDRQNRELKVVAMERLFKEE
jgi:glycine cleavage system regulatory protein